MIFEVERALVEKMSDNDDRVVYVLRPVLATSEVKKKEDWRRNNIFQTRVRCNRQLCSLVINGGSLTNIGSEEGYRKVKTENRFPSKSIQSGRGQQYKFQDS